MQTAGEQIDRAEQEVQRLQAQLSCGQKAHASRHHGDCGHQLCALNAAIYNIHFVPTRQAASQAAAVCDAHSDRAKMSLVISDTSYRR